MAARTEKVPTGPRVRRKPEVGEREILDAAEEILRKQDFRDLTVDAVMGGTGMVRSAFYNYFENRNELIMRLIERVEGKMMEVSQAWLEDSSGDPSASIKEGLKRVAEVYAEHGHLLRAVHEASYHDRQVERYYRGGLVQNFIDAVAKRLEQEKADGRTSVDDPGQTATALLLMNADYFDEQLGGAQSSRGASPQAVAATLSEIWVRTIYLQAQ